MSNVISFTPGKKRKAPPKPPAYGLTVDDLTWMAAATNEAKRLHALCEEGSETKAKLWAAYVAMLDATLTAYEDGIDRGLR